MNIVSMRTILGSNGLGGTGESANPGPVPVVKAAAPQVHDYMKRMAPLSCPADEGEILPLSAIMCSIMILNSVMERTGNRVLEEHGLTMPQWLALGCISHAGEEGIPHSHLGQRLMLSKAPITGIVDRLGRAGLVERKADAKDRRISRAIATPTGCDTWWRVKNALRGATESICGESLTPAEQQQLLNLLGRIMNDFAAHDPMMPEFSKSQAAPQEASQP